MWSLCTCWWRPDLQKQASPKKSEEGWQNNSIWPPVSLHGFPGFLRRWTFSCSTSQSAVNMRQMKFPFYIETWLFHASFPLSFMARFLLSLTRLSCCALKKWIKWNKWDFWSWKRKASEPLFTDRNHLNKGSRWLGWWPRGPVEITLRSQTPNSHTCGKRSPEQYEVMWTVQYIRKWSKVSWLYVITTFENSMFYNLTESCGNQMKDYCHFLKEPSMMDSKGHK